MDLEVTYIVKLFGVIVIKMKRTFGIRHIGIFSPLIVMEEDGFIYKNKKYKWEDILLIKRDDSIVSALARYPSIALLICDGTIIRVPSIIEEKDRHEGFKFQAFKFRNKAYNELISIIETNIIQKRLELEKYVLNYNYIMLYRHLIAIGLIMLFSFSIILKFLDVKIDLGVMLFGFFSLTVVVSGIFLLLKRHRNERCLRDLLRGDRMGYEGAGKRKYRRRFTQTQM